MLDRVEAAPELLSAAAERAVQVARRDRAKRDADPVPSALRPFLNFTRKMPARAQRSVLGVLDSDAAFRMRVAEGAEESEIGRASWLFLTRPESWYSDLGLMCDDVMEERRDTHAARAELTAQRRAEQQDEAIERLRQELTDALSELDEAGRTIAELRAAILIVQSERDDLATSAARLEDDRARAVRELKATEAIAAERLDKQRADRDRLTEALSRLAELESAGTRTAGGQMEPASDGGLMEPASDGGPAVAEMPLTAALTESWPIGARIAVAEAVARAAATAGELGAALSVAAEALAVTTAPDLETAAGQDTGDALRANGPPRAAVRSSAQRPSRRVPVRLTGGVVEGTVEALLQLLAKPGMVVLIDGYNVTMEGWLTFKAAEQRDLLVNRLGALQSRVAAVIHVVFDGESDGARPSVGVPLPVRVHFSPAGVEADDLILETVTGIPTDTPVLVISSDNRVASGARRLGANVSSSASLLELLRS